LGHLPTQNISRRYRHLQTFYVFQALDKCFCVAKRAANLLLKKKKARQGAPGSLNFFFSYSLTPE
jgi:hypothetical protein